MRNRGGDNGLIEQEFYDNNTTNIDDLASRITEMSDISSSIKNHLRNEQKILEETNANFGENENLLKTVIGKVGTQLQAGGTRSYIYLIVCVITILALLWFLGQSRNSHTRIRNNNYQRKW